MIYFLFNQGRPDITPSEFISHLATVNYETCQRGLVAIEASRSVALATQNTSQKKETMEVTEESLVVKQMSKYVTNEMEKRKAKQKLKKHHYKKKRYKRWINSYPRLSPTELQI